MPDTRNHTLRPATGEPTCVMGVGNQETVCGAQATYVHAFEWHLRGHWRQQHRPLCETHAGTVARAFRLPGADRFDIVEEIIIDNSEMLSKLARR